MRLCSRRRPLCAAASGQGRAAAPYPCRPRTPCACSAQARPSGPPPRRASRHASGVGIQPRPRLGQRRRGSRTARAPVRALPLEALTARAPRRQAWAGAHARRRRRRAPAVCVRARRPRRKGRRARARRQSSSPRRVCAAPCPARPSAHVAKGRGARAHRCEARRRSPHRGRAVAAWRGRAA
jgi:hypothetical protein